MMRLTCPWCGVRDEIEFTWGGQADIHRPQEPASCDDRQWSEYLFLRDNPCGIHRERWCHTYGCGLWFEIDRDTLTHRSPAAETICPDLAKAEGEQ